MKTTTKLLAIFSALFLILSLQQAQAQKFSVTLNYSNFTQNNDIITQNGEIELGNSANVSLNARYYTNSKFAFRAGVGMEQLNYQFNSSNGLATDFESRRNDLQGFFGLEWHPTLGKAIDIYPGLYIPVTVVGDDLINNNLNSLSNGGLSAGMGALLGVNVKILKIFRAGVEFDAQYQNFKAATVDAVNELSLQPYRRLNYTANFTFGIMI